MDMEQTVFNYRKVSTSQVTNLALILMILAKLESYSVIKLWLLISTAMVRVSAILFLKIRLFLTVFE